MSVAPVLQPFYEGWTTHQRRLLAAIADLDPEQLALRPAPAEWAIWQLASHMAGSRAYWFHDVLGEGNPAIRDMFRAASTTVPDVPLENAGWEDDESHPGAAAEIVEAFHLTWAVVAACLERWSADDITAQIPQRGADRYTTRGWVIWHLMEHEAHHGGVIWLGLGSNGLAGLDIQGSGAQSPCGNQAPWGWRRQNQPLPTVQGPNWSACVRPRSGPTR